MKYVIKKRVIVGAIRWSLAQKDVEPSAWTEGKCAFCGISMQKHGQLRYSASLVTVLCPDDWIVTHEDGSKSAVHNAIFRTIYEPLDA